MGIRATERRIRLRTVMTWRIERKTRNLTLRFVRFGYRHFPSLLALTGSVVSRQQSTALRCLNWRVLAVDRNYP